METSLEKTGRLNKILRSVYLSLMGVLLFWYLYSLATFSSQYRTPGWVLALRCATAVLAVYLGKLWKDKGFLALAALLALMLVRMLIPFNPTRLGDLSVRESLFMGVWLFGACYGMARVLNRRELKRFLQIFISVWTAGMAVYCAISLYVAWTDQTVYTLGGGARWWISMERLTPIFYSNTAASMLCVSALAALCFMLGTGKRWVQILLLLSVLLMTVTISLTDSRTEKIIFALGLAAMVAWLLSAHLRQSRNKTQKISLLVGCACFLLVTAGMILLFGQITNAFNQAKLSGSILVSSARAENAGATAITHRGLKAGKTLLNGRETIWQAVLEYLKTNPKYLIYGTSLYDPMSGPSELLGSTYVHCHNTALQVLLECGIPGLLLLAAFATVLIRRCFRVLKAGGTLPKWIVLLPLALLPLLFGEMIDCFIVLLRPYTPQQALVFIGMGIVCAFGKPVRANLQENRPV